jgi:hypothetical protein
MLGERLSITDLLSDCMGITFFFPQVFNKNLFYIESLSIMLMLLWEMEEEKLSSKVVGGGQPQSEQKTG